jgi:hypothetical protein
VVNTDANLLLHFLAPGFLHQLRTALLAVQGQAQLLDPETAGQPKAEIMAATKRGQAAIQVLRCLAGDGGGTVRAAVLLPRLVEVLSVPMHARGLAVSWQHSSPDEPARVDGTLLSQTVAGALLKIAEGLPTGFGGSLVVELCAESPDTVEIWLNLIADGSRLPFQVDLLRVQQELQAEISSRGGLALLVGRKLVLHLPTLAAEPEAGPETGEMWADLRGDA